MTEDQESQGNGGVTAEKVEQAKIKFVEYEAACEEEKQLDDMIEALRAKKSGIVQEIESLLGKGPFKYRGEELAITRRKDTYYFKGKNRIPPTVID